MDVVALLKTHKQPFKSFDVEVDIETSQGVQPAGFTKAVVTFNAIGDIDRGIFLEAVKLSQTKYCGVSAMLAKALPIHYIVILNSEKIGEGQAHFGGS